MPVFKTAFIALAIIAGAALAGGTAATFLKPDVPPAPQPPPAGPMIQERPMQVVQDCSSCRQIYGTLTPGMALPKGVPYSCWDCFAADLQAAKIFGDNKVAHLVAAPDAIWVYWPNTGGWKPVYPETNQ